MAAVVPRSRIEARFQLIFFGCPPTLPFIPRFETWCAALGLWRRPRSPQAFQCRVRAIQSLRKNNSCGDPSSLYFSLATNSESSTAFAFMASDHSCCSRASPLIICPPNCPDKSKLLPNHGNSSQKHHQNLLSTDPWNYCSCTPHRVTYCTDLDCAP